MDTKEFLLISDQLLDRFKEIAPGTFRHCQNVTQLCESLAKELNLDDDTLMLAAAFHDIGKCSSPENFIENQTTEVNLHDTLDPMVSFQLISRHLSDSVLKLTQLNAPVDIVKIVSEHHGNSTIKSIFIRAKEVYKGVPAEEHYKYRSTKPTSLESCVLMCCDVVESACRALSNNGKLKDYKVTVDKLINGLIEDEQLDILSLGQFRVIKRILTSEISNIYHKRIDYEENDVKQD
jgi:putative nucleotidyltransferase with HDIG domain